MKVACSHCHGAGLVMMDPTYAETYVALSRSWTSTAKVHAAHGFPPSRPALCNRLAWLYRRGFVERRRNPDARCGYEWRRKP